jgi:hypothetical protein
MLTLTPKYQNALAVPVQRRPALSYAVPRLIGGPPPAPAPGMMSGLSAPVPGCRLLSVTGC